MPIKQQNKKNIGAKKEANTDRKKTLETHRVYWFCRRLQDIVFSAVALVALSPLMLITAIIIVIDDPSGGPIFSQDRVGRDGKIFKFYKFRSMCVDAEEKLESLLELNEMDGPVFKIKDDPRIIRVGKFFRKTGIDELPQLWNVLKGDMSISGYFGVSCSIKKVVRLETTVIMYAVLSALITIVLSGIIDVKSIVKALMPISSGKYWYMTTYMLLLLFSKYINAAPEKLSKKEFRNLIILLFAVFSLLPTVIQVHIMGDVGKGFANILLAYYIGRYIRLYKSDVRIRYYALTGIISMVICIGLNYKLSILKGGVGICAPFARDCSVFILIASVCIFFMFLQLDFKSGIINCLASHVIGVYLFEGAVRNLADRVFDLSGFVGSNLFPVMVIPYVVIVVLACIAFDSILTPVIGAITSLVSKILDKLLTKFSPMIKIITEK